MIGTRIVENGKIGYKQRQLDAVSEKADGRGVPVDGRVLGSTIEMLRADWAERMRQASGDRDIDHRSFMRRGILLYPVAHVTRGEIEHQKRRNRETWREQRAQELALRIDNVAAVAGRTETAAARTSAEAAAMLVSRSQHAPGPPRDVGRLEQQAIEADGSLVGSAPIETAPSGAEGVAEDEKRRGEAASPASQPAGRTAAMPVLASFARAHRKLRHEHRLSAAREQQLAVTAGVDIDTLRRASIALVSHEADHGGDANDQAWPPSLVALIVGWEHEDRQARTARRKGGGRRVADEAAPAPASRSDDVPWSSAGLHVANGPAVAPRTHPPRPRAQPPEQDNKISAAGIAPAVDAHAGPEAVSGSDILTRAVVAAHADDILLRAYTASRPPPSEMKVLYDIARRLRATGLDRDEVVRYLRVGSASAWPRDELERAVASAFSDKTTIWLSAAPAYRKNASMVSDRAEAAIYRRLRKDALDEFRRELDAVWAKRSADTEAVMARHRRDMAWIRELRWTNRKLQRRGIVLAVLSLMVELAMLRPLVALEHFVTEQERRDLNDAARKASDALKARRDDWRAAASLPRTKAAQGHGAHSASDLDSSVPPAHRSSIVAERPAEQTAGRTNTTKRDEAHGRWTAGQSHGGRAKNPSVVDARSRSANDKSRLEKPSSEDLVRAVLNGRRRRGKTLSDLQSCRARRQLQKLRQSDDPIDKISTLTARARAEGDPMKQRLMIAQLRQELSQRPRGSRAPEVGTTLPTRADAAEVTSKRLTTSPATTARLDEIIQAEVARSAPIPASAPSGADREEARAATSASDRVSIAVPAKHGQCDTENATLSAGRPAASSPENHVPARPTAGDSVRDGQLEGFETQVVGDMRAMGTPNVQPASASQDELRRLAIDFAVLVAASNRWPPDRIQALAAVAGMSGDQLRDGMSRRIEELAGTAGPRPLDRLLKQLQNATWVAAKETGHSELLRAMRALRWDGEGPGGRGGPGRRGNSGDRGNSDGPGSR